MQNRARIINLIESTATFYWQTIAFKYVNKVIVFRRYNDMHIELLDEKGVKLLNSSNESRLKSALMWVRDQKLFEQFVISDTPPITTKVCVVVWKLDLNYIDNISSKYIDAITVDKPVPINECTIDPYKSILSKHIYDVLEPNKTREKVLKETEYYDA